MDTSLISPAAELSSQVPDHVPAPAPAPRPPRSLFRAAAVFLPLLFLVFVFLNIGRWLVVSDPLQHADAILVLSGSMPARATEAASLYRRGFAPQVWLTHSENVDEALDSLGIQYLDENYYNIQILQKLGVPPESIRILAVPILNTADEVRVASDELQRTGASAIIIVTSPPHTRRARSLWRSYAPYGRVIVHPAPQDSYDADHWWRNTHDVLSVLRESMGLINSWAGLPISAAR
jgi:uncharacterized SAM-binding protein YcdF (DUF218 family)